MLLENQKNTQKKGKPISLEYTFLLTCKDCFKVKSYQKTNADGSTVCPLAIMKEKNAYLLINDLYLQQKSFNKDKI